MRKDLLTIGEVNTDDIEKILEKGLCYKKEKEQGKTSCPLIGKSLGMLFEKASTRTRVSFEVAMYQLGGQAIFLTPLETQLGRGESIADTAKVLSRYLDGMVVRTFSQKTLEEFAECSSIPVINGLTDMHHPCQGLSDLFTIKEKKGGFRGIRLAYLGDGNNVAHSLIEGSSKVGMDIVLACPKGYEPNKEIVDKAMNDAKKNGCRIEVLNDPVEAVEDVDVLYTDVWTSMGQESEKKQRIDTFKDYQINQQIVNRAKKDVMVMHCLPAYRGKEITAEVIDGPNSVVFEQAENRLYVEKAILDIYLGSSLKG
ncbi:MAG: ornithine carbamoyltransferase [Nitrospirota bacterium]